MTELREYGGATVPEGPSNRTTMNLLVLCIAAGCGPLFLKASGLLSIAVTRPLPPQGDVTGVVYLVVPLLVLLVWRVSPSRSWPWLLLIGAFAALPWVLVRMLPGLYYGELGYPMAVIGGCAPAFTLIGTLGAAVWLWQAGRRRAAAAVIGSAPVLQLIGPVVVLSTMIEAAWLFEVLGVLLIVLAVVGSIGAVVISRGLVSPEQLRRPGLVLTVVGGVAAGCQILTYFWDPAPSPHSLLNGSPVGDYYLHVGLVFLAVGLLAAAFFGRLVLLCSLGIGMLVGAFAMLVSPSTEQLDQMPVIAVIAAVVSIALGTWAVLSRWRVQLGTAGLLLAVLVLFIMYLLFNRDDSLNDDDPFVIVATPLLVPVAVVAGMSMIAELGSRLNERAETPPVLVGLITPVASAAMAITAHFGIHAPEDRAPVVGVLPPVMVCLLVAVVVLGAVAGTWARTTTSPTEQPYSVR